MKYPFHVPRSAFSWCNDIHQNWRGGGKSKNCISQLSRDKFLDWHHVVQNVTFDVSPLEMSDRKLLPWHGLSWSMSALKVRENCVLILIILLWTQIILHFSSYGNSQTMFREDGLEALLTFIQYEHVRHNLDLRDIREYIKNIGLSWIKIDKARKKLL